MIAVGIIPARYAATRLPGKPLLPIAGRPMIQHVYEQARRAETLSAVMVATDDERIAAAVSAFGGEAIMTSTTHRSGTDRLAEAARDLRADVIVNIQGDEPLIDPGTIDSLVAPFEARPELAMATLSTPILRAEDAAADSVVKVVVDRESYAIYFSRLPIPFYRDENVPPAAAPARHRKHIGLYAYRKEALMRFASLPPTPLEQAEALEQLRALEHGMRILVVPTAHDAISVDTPEDLERVRRLFQGVEEE